MIWTHNLNPVLLDLGFLQVRWYGIFYAVSFLLAYFWLRNSAQKKLINISAQQVEDLIFGIILGVILGGRIGYFLFYNFSEFFSLEILKIWHGGMSFHGGLIGVLLAIFYFARKWRKSFFEISDLITIPAALGLMFGRLGNFVNGELWGKPTNADWGVVFPSADEQPRFPSQLFEAAKNLLIAEILFSTFRQKPRRGILSFLFLTFYGGGRILVEFFLREPLDGFIFGMPRGAFFSIPVLLIGVAGLLWVNKKA
ncbi:prolipoprotein diacylglyceryl transferase [Candidatus Gracilibacteria bacterium]|nr:prolipoprotein diacylglyceryl transferase [Candidatus Gracilibacteria bacterium]MCF7856098.1 prolipoprotein diacylglyceryl transferase [Candidatus Gracilibacteria bacterium]MCF7896517.1 prolipoprotein diacylglyceryl transferase [Candidatus Gracilibacteria bacterium]